MHHFKTPYKLYRQMRKTLFTTILLAISYIGLGQINMEDSTVQVVAYFDKGEQQIYSLTSEKIKISGSDTTSKELITYEVEITVKDSTDKSYTIEWFYKNINTNSTNETAKKLLNVSKDMKVIYMTDEVGSFIEVVNWKEIRDFNKKACASLRTEYKDIPEMEKVINQIEVSFSTKESIESVSIKDIRQFHTYHGAKYKLGEVIEGQQEIPNIYGAKPFDSYSSVFLDEINVEDNNFILRSSQEIDSNQLTEAILQYLTQMAKNMKIDPPKREDVKDLKNETNTASRIHNSGWILYSIQTTTVVSDNSTNIEERIIEMN